MQTEPKESPKHAIGFTSHTKYMDIAFKQYSCEGGRDRLGGYGETPRCPDEFPKANTPSGLQRND